MQKITCLIDDEYLKRSHHRKLGTPATAASSNIPKATFCTGSTGFLSQLGAKLRDWTVRVIQGDLGYSWAALSLIDSKTLYASFGQATGS